MWSDVNLCWSYVTWSEAIDAINRYNYKEHYGHDAEDEGNHLQKDAYH